MPDALAIGGEIVVRRLGFGAMRLCGPGIWGWPEDRESALRVIRRAVELGVQLIDTAAVYGPEVNELQIAQALRPYPSDLVIATKGGSTRGSRGEWVTTAGRKRCAVTAREASSGSVSRRSRSTSCMRPTAASRSRRRWALSRSCRRRARSATCVSNVTVDELQRARSVLEIAAVQNRYNIADRESELVLELCEREGIAFLPYFPIARGTVAEADGALVGIAPLTPRRRRRSRSRVARALTRDLPDPRHLLARASRGEHGRRRARALAGRARGARPSQTGTCARLGSIVDGRRGNVALVHRLGLIGAGKVARVHAANLARTDGVRLVAVADVVAEAARSLAQEAGADALSPEGLLERRDVAAVLIATPPDTHADLIVEAAAAGKHVFCEKPLATSLADARRALEAVERAGVLLQIGYNRRFDPHLRAVRDAVAEGRVGTPWLLRISSRDPAPPPADYLPHSGGLFLDTTSHDFDLARFVLESEIVELAVLAASVVDPNAAALGDVDVAVLSLAFSNGAFGAIDNCRRSPYGYDQRLEVHGSDGLAQAENRPAEFYTDRYAEAFAHELVAFARALDGEPLEVDGRDGLAAVAAAEAARRSLDEGRAVRLEELE